MIIFARAIDASVDAESGNSAFTEGSFMHCKVKGAALKCIYTSYFRGDWVYVQLACGPPATCGVADGGEEVPAPCWNLDPILNHPEIRLAEYFINRLSFERAFVTALEADTFGEVSCGVSSAGGEDKLESAPSLGTTCTSGIELGRRGDGGG